VSKSGQSAGRIPRNCYPLGLERLKELDARVVRIAFVTSEYVMPNRAEGGLANYLKKTGEELARRGADIWIFVPSDRNACWRDGPLLVSEVRKTALFLSAAARVPVLRRLAPVAHQLLTARRLARRFRKTHRREAFDIIQVSNYRAPGYFLRKNGRVPMVCRVSSYAPLYRSAYGRTRNLSESLSDWLEMRQVLDAEAAFAPSRFIAEAYDRLEGYRPHVIPTPVDLSEVTPDPTYYQQRLDGVSYLLVFGTLSRTKGVDVLADVIPSVLARHATLSFVFVGRDDGLPNGQAMSDYVRSKCAGYESRLLFSPALPKTQLYPVIAGAVGVMMPSRVDNYPNACLEAQSLGVPVVGTYESSLEEMIVDGETGFLAGNGDSASLLAAIERLLAQTPDQRAEVKERIQAHVDAIVSEDRVGQLEAFYQSVVDRFHAAEDSRVMG
jgi:glycogen synthase